MPRLVWWPSALALVAVAGAILCIMFPLRGLEARWLVGVGLISYAFYLWHWPILKGLDILWPGPPDGILALAIFISIGLASRLCVCDTGRYCLVVSCAEWIPGTVF